MYIIDVEVDENSISIVFDCILEDGLNFYSFLRVLISPSLSVVYIDHLFKRLVIHSMLFVSVSSEFIIVIISPFIMEAAPGAIAVMVSSSNRYSILSNVLDYAILSNWCAWLYLASQCFIN